MYQIQYGFLKSKGRFICLLDGDDIFSDLKLSRLSKLLKKSKTKIIQDVPILFSKNFKIESKVKNYKENFLYKKNFY